MVENMNTIRLLHGECRATNEEMKKFQKGDTIWGNDTSPEEFEKWHKYIKSRLVEQLSKLKKISCNKKLVVTYENKINELLK